MEFTNNDGTDGVAGRVMGSSSQATRPFLRTLEAYIENRYRSRWDVYRPDAISLFLCILHR